MNFKKPASSIQNPAVSLVKPKFSSQPANPLANFLEHAAGGNQTEMYNYLMRMMGSLANKDDPTMPTYNLNRKVS
jgi:hypothetical protein